MEANKKAQAEWNSGEYYEITQQAAFAGKTLGEPQWPGPVYALFLGLVESIYGAETSHYYLPRLLLDAHPSCPVLAPATQHPPSSLPPSSPGLPPCTPPNRLPVTCRPEPEDIAKFTAEDLNAYVRRVWAPDRVCVIVSGASPDPYGK